SIPVQANGERIEAPAAARSSRTVAGVRREEGAVGRADEEPAILREELVRPPVERRAGVDAEVHVGVEPALEVDDEALEPAAAPGDRELLGPAGRDPGRDGGPLPGSAHDGLPIQGRISPGGPSGRFRSVIREPSDRSRLAPEAKAAAPFFLAAVTIALPSAPADSLTTDPSILAATTLA